MALACLPVRILACRCWPTPRMAPEKFAFALRRAKHSPAIKPITLPRAVPGGFDRDDFVIDHRGAHRELPRSSHGVDQHPRRRQLRCSLPRLSAARRCTTSKRGRVLHIHEHDRELVEARRAWRDGDFTDDYRRWRPMVERSLAWLVAHGHRRVRYHGVERNHHGLMLRAAAINLRRLLNLGLTPSPIGWALS